MRKSDIANRVASEADVPGNVANKAVDVVFSAVGEALPRGEDVTVRGFGSFSPKSRPQRTGRNLRTGRNSSYRPRRRCRSRRPPRSSRR